VRDPTVHASVLEELLGWSAEHGFGVLGLTASPIRGPAGNVEFLAHLQADAAQGALNWRGLVAAALAEAATPAPART
jgi:23S rRNA (cytidine1920-2'-O)/16S rRNA (cytidine1409-2'-O)-methyltransferase